MYRSVDFASSLAYNLRSLLSLKLMTGALKVPLNTYLLPRRSFFFGISLQGHGWLAAGDSFNSSMPGNPGRSVINHANIVEEADSLWLMICVILPLFDDPLVVSNLTEDVQSHAHRINDISGLRSGKLVQGAICRATLDLEIRKKEPRPGPGALRTAAGRSEGSVSEPSFISLFPVSGPSHDISYLAVPWLL